MSLKRHEIAILTAGLLLGATAGVFAADDAKNWKDTAEVSYLATNGNTKTSTLGAGNLFVYQWTKTALEIDFRGLGTESAGQVTAEQYQGSEMDYRLNTETALIASVNSFLSLKTSFKWNRVAQPTPGFIKDDTTVAAALILNY